jgi:hypothetical protein
MLHWVIQENLINPQTRDQLVLLLKERNVPFTLVKLIPFFHQIEGEVHADGQSIFVYGSTGLGEVAKTRGWSPGYFDQNLDYELMLDQYGALALNAGAVCAPLGELPRAMERFFIRPVLDNKSFAGTIMTWHELEQFRAGVASIADEKDATLRLSDRVVMAPLTAIRAEYRIFVIGGELAAASRYKLGERVESSLQIPAEVLAFAERAVEHWRPNDAFTIDIAETDTGLKVIELNSANSAGFYACNVGQIIDAVNQRLVR